MGPKAPEGLATKRKILSLFPTLLIWHVQGVFPHQPILQTPTGCPTQFGHDSTWSWHKPHKYRAQCHKAAPTPCQSQVPGCHLHFWSTNYKLRVPNIYDCHLKDWLQIPQLSIHKSPGTTENKEAVLHGNTSTFYGYPPRLSMAASENAQLPASPWNGFDSTLSQLLPKGQEFRSSVSRTGARDQTCISSYIRATY